MKKVEPSRKIVGWNMILVGVLSLYLVMGAIWQMAENPNLQEIKAYKVTERAYVIEDEPIPAGGITKHKTIGSIELVYGVGVGCMGLGIMMYKKG